MQVAVTVQRVHGGLTRWSIKINGRVVGYTDHLGGDLWRVRTKRESWIAQADSPRAVGALVATRP